MLELPRARLDRAPQASLAGLAEQAAGLDLAGEGAGVDPAAVGDGLAQGRSEGLRRGQDALHVHVEPAIDRLLDEVGADHDQQQRGRHRHQQEHQHEAQPEARAQHAPASLEEDAHQVAAEDEDQDEKEREVENGEPIQEDRGEEVGREVPALAEKHLDREEDPHGHGGERQDEARVVAQGES